MGATAYTDASVSGELEEGFGPFQLINGRAFEGPEGIRPGILLRIDSYAEERAHPPYNSATDNSRYHAGTLADEIAALISLSAGIRLKAAPANRVFFPGANPKGIPYLTSTSPSPVWLVGSTESRILPRVCGSICLNELDLLLRIEEVSELDAASLVLAARSYQNALWNAESEPEIAWLLLVSAVETVAQRWSQSDEDPLDSLAVSMKNLFDTLMVHGEEHARAVASQLVRLTGSTSKFVKFLLAHLPPEPTDRPPKWIQFEWTEKNFKKAFSMIYGYRSGALHAGEAFPLPMCKPPFLEGKRFGEIPHAGATSMGNHHWQSKDTPMLLHLFEFIVHSALNSWWRGLLDTK